MHSYNRNADGFWTYRALQPINNELVGTSKHIDDAIAWQGAGFVILSVGRNGDAYHTTPDQQAEALQ